MHGRDGCHYSFDYNLCQRSIGKHKGHRVGTMTLRGRTTRWKALPPGSSMQQGAKALPEFDKAQ